MSANNNGVLRHPYDAIYPHCYVSLWIDNVSSYEFYRCWPQTIVLAGEQDRPPTDVRPHAVSIEAGSFKSAGYVPGVRAASIYGTPDPTMYLILFVSVPFDGPNIVKVHVVDGSLTIDRDLIALIEQDETITNEVMFDATLVTGQKRRFTARGEINDRKKTAAATFSLGCFD